MKALNLILKTVLLFFTMNEVCIASNNGTYVYSEESGYNVVIKIEDHVQQVQFNLPELSRLRNPNMYQTIVNAITEKFSSEKLTLINIFKLGGGTNFYFLDFMELLKAKSKTVWMKISGECYSACTFWALQAHHTFYVPDFLKDTGFIGFHKGKGRFGQQSVNNMISLYVELGADHDILEANRHLFVAHDSIAKVSYKKANEMGFADTYLDTQSEFDTVINSAVKRYFH